MTSHATLRRLAEEEQECLWNDLDNAIRYALNGIWSIEASGKASRLVRFVRAVGPIHPDCLGWPLVGGGVYDMLCGFAGVKPIHYSVEEFAETERLMTKHGGTGAALHAQFVPVRQAMLHYRADIVAD